MSTCTCARFTRTSTSVRSATTAVVRSRPLHLPVEGLNAGRHRGVQGSVHQGNGQRSDRRRPDASKRAAEPVEFRRQDLPGLSGGKSTEPQRPSRHPLRRKRTEWHDKTLRGLTPRGACDTLDATNATVLSACARTSPMSAAIANRMTATKNTILAASTATPAMPPKPSTAAISATTKNVTAQPNMAVPLVWLRIKSACEENAGAKNCSRSSPQCAAHQRRSP